MGDPGKYSRRRREQEREARGGPGDGPWEQLERMPLDSWRYQYPWGCMSTSLASLVLGMVLVAGVLAIAGSC
jgi:hypothetical protein